MKILLYACMAILTLLGLFPTGYHGFLAQNQHEKSLSDTPSSDFEKAVEIIKKYETLHQPKHWPLVGYGHKVLPGEKFSRNKAMDAKQAEDLLRKDLLKNCAVFRSYGADSLLLGVLAYNIGSGTVRKSSLAKKLKEGNRDIRDIYIAYSKYRGKTHTQLKNRRIEEFETLFIENIENYEKTSVVDNITEQVIVVEDD